MGTISESWLAKTGDTEINSKMRNKYFFIVCSSAKMLKIHEALHMYRFINGIYC